MAGFSPRSPNRGQPTGVPLGHPRPDGGDGRGNAPGPRLAVARQRPACLDPLDPRERRERLGRVARERGDLRPDRAARDGVRRERIADEQRVLAGEVECRAPRGVARDVDDPRRARDVERRAVTERRDLGEGRRPERAVTRAEQQEPDERPDPDLPGLLALRLDLAAGHRRVELVDRGQDRPLAAESLGEAEVVAVAVGQHERPDVVERAAHRGQLAREVGPVAGHAGVDDRHLARLLDQVGVDVCRCRSGGGTGRSASEPPGQDGSSDTANWPM